MPKYCETKKDYGLNYNNDEHISYKMIHDKKTGEEKLVENEKISITEQLEETELIVKNYNEIIMQEAENKKAENLIDMQTNEEFMQELEEASNSIQDDNIYSIMDKMQTINKIFNNLPKNLREEYKTPQNFATKNLKKFIVETKKRIEEQQNNNINKNTSYEEQNNKLQQEIEKLKNQINKNKEETK